MSRYLALCFLFMTSFVPSLFACEGCKEPSSVAGSSGVNGIGAGFSWSVIFMIGMISLLVAGMIVMIVRACKQLEAQQSAAVVQSH
jgi:hypothetical protein